LSFGAIWQSNWFLGSILTLLFVLTLNLQPAPFNSLENIIYDSQAPQATNPVDKRIIILNIDQASRRQSGLGAELATAFAINKLSAANAALIGIHTIFNKARPASNTLPSSPLTDAIHHSGNTLLAIQFELNQGIVQNLPLLDQQLKTMALKHVQPTSETFNAALMKAPYKQLIQSAAGMGHINTIKDSDGILRSEALAIAYGDYYFPSLTLILAAQTLNMNPDDIRIQAGKSIELGPLNIDIDAKIRIYPAIRHDNNTTAFPVYTFNKLYNGQLESRTFTNKIILIGNAGHQPDNIVTTAGNDNMTRIEFSAHVLQSILHQHMIQRPGWTQAIEFALLLIIGCYLIALPRLSTKTAMMISSLLFITLISSDWLLLHYYAFWLQTITAALLLLTGHVLITSKQRFQATQTSPKTKPDIHATNKMLALSFQNQGMLDKAFEKFIACPMDDDLLGRLDALAQACERKKQFQQASAVYEHIASHDPIYKDIQARIMAAKNSHQALKHSNANATLSSQLLDTEHQTTLGRYEIISELGKGAMGTVYLGKDPKINRQVAIKTMALSQEFKPEELEEVKSKFFHEAEIAGMLNHPNIVTIFDAGDEQDLAYIAMEFLDGIDLSPYTKKGKLLPLITTLKIVANVAEALQYAHGHGVIHRDIKPANIMILKNKAVKVTDFGIAHIIESSKTKAGVVLGTPSYMSPEQLSGKALDGRSDLFSLGVMLYELICGVRPFRAESISKLMYKIAKQPHVDVREHNADISDSISLLINDLLSKKADQRIQTASDVQARVSLCLRELNSSGENQ